MYLENNSIRVLPDELFIGCPNLLWLDLRCNRIRRLPDGIIGHNNLQVLLLGKNDMKRLPHTLGKNHCSSKYTTKYDPKSVK